MSNTCIFVGPYVECLSQNDVWPTDLELREAWDQLLNDRKRLEWNMPFGSARILELEGAELYQYCGIPIEQRAGCRRWPMLMQFEGLLRDSQNFDWSNVDPVAEIEWFKNSYDHELAILNKIFNSHIVFHWGLVYWPR
jgi:hypothetical protein